MSEPTNIGAIEHVRNTPSCDSFIAEHSTNLHKSAVPIVAGFGMCAAVVVAIMAGIWSFSLLPPLIIMAVAALLSALGILFCEPMRQRHPYMRLHRGIKRHDKLCREFNRRLLALEEYAEHPDSLPIPESMLASLALQRVALWDRSNRLEAELVSRKQHVALRKTERKLKSADRKMLREHQAKQLQLKAASDLDRRLNEVSEEFRQLAVKAGEAKQAVEDAISAALRKPIVDPSEY